MICNFIYACIALSQFLVIVRGMCVYLTSGATVGAGVLVASGVDAVAFVIVSFFLYRIKI